MNVFQAFPNACENWQIGKMKYSTITGNIFGVLSTIEVVVDTGTNSTANNSPSAQNMASDTLLYCKPEQLPTLDTAKLVASYAVQAPNGKIYAIEDAALGKNQDGGVVEHVELKLNPTAVA